MAVHNDEDDPFWLFHCTGVDQDSISGHYLEKIGTYAIAIEDRKYRLVKKRSYTIHSDCLFRENDDKPIILEKNFKKRSFTLKKNQVLNLLKFK